MLNWLQDVRHGTRALIRARGFAVSAIGTMALAIGAVVTIFTVVDRVLLRPLPFTGAARVVQLCEVSPETGPFCSASPLNVDDLARESQVIDAAGVARGEGFAVELDGARVGLRGAIATPGFFDVVGLRAELGRLLEPGDMPQGSNHVVIVSHAFWRDRLGASPAAVGMLLRVDSRDVRVIGVLPDEAYIPYFDGVQMWKPASAGLDDAGRREWRGFTGVARMREGVSWPAAEAGLVARYRELARLYPDENAGWDLRVESLRDRIVRPIRQPVLLFQVAVGMLLLIACANVAGLLLVRTAGRDAEFAIRRALGAGRWRLRRQMFAEGLVLSIVSAVIGLGIAAFALRTLRTLAPADMPRLAEVQIDARIALATFALAVLTAVAFSLVPAGRRSMVASLRAQRHGGARGRLPQVFAAAQLALALALLASAGLVTRAFVRLAAWEPGFDRGHVQTAWLVAPPDRVGPIDAAVTALLSAREAVAALPGVEGAGLVSAGPLFGGSETGALRLPDRPGAGEWTVSWFDADEGYFPALGVRALRGRLITRDDTYGADRVAVINDTLARQVFGDEDAIGRRIVIGDYASTVVGVVPAMVPEPGAVPRPEVYWPIRQYRRYAAYLVVRVAPGAAPSPAVMQRAIHDAVPVIDAPLARPLETRFAAAMIAPRFSMWLALAFALAAGAVAAVGLYAVVAAAVAGRKHEIGVRLALGATPERMAASFLTQALVLVAAGGAAGLGLVLLSGRLLSRVLYGLPPADPLVLGAAFVLLAAAAAIAAYLPARRAARVDPLTTLRES